MKSGTPEEITVNTGTHMQKKSSDSNNNDKLSFNVSNNSETKMTTSDSQILICEQPKQQIKKQSASVACLEPSSYEPKGDNVTAGTSSVNDSMVCSILNCSAHFSSEDTLQQHNTLFKHSPCNPVLLNRDSRLAQCPICYMCPKCDREFQKSEECKKHMVSENHLPFYPPLAVTAYMCAQCLHLFESFEDCWKHLEKMSHHTVTYAFTDDQSSSDNQSGPVAVVSELVQDFIGRCNKVPYSLQCLDCEMEIESNSNLQNHKVETQNQHTMASFTETTVVDVFANYLAAYTCNMCHRLFSGELKELAKHQCAKKIIGTIVDNDTSSFTEFVKRCGLTLIKSVDVDGACLPGPSHCNREMRRKHWMDTVLDNDSDGACSVDIELEGCNDKLDSSNKNVPKSKGNDASLDKKGKTLVLKDGRNSVKAVNNMCIERPKSDKSVGPSIRENKSVENSNDNEKHGNQMVVILDDSDTSDDVELIVNGSSKRKRKQKTSDRNKQHAACDVPCNSNGAKSKTGLQDIFTSHTGTPVCINLIDDSPVPPDISVGRRCPVASQKSSATVVEETSRIGTSRESDFEEQTGHQSKHLILNLFGKDKKKGNRIVIDIDSDDDVEATEPNKAVSPSGYSKSKAGAWTGSPPGPSIVNQTTAGRAVSPPLSSAYSLTNPFAAFNFTPHSPKLPQNVLTKGYVQPHILKPQTAVNNLNGMMPICSTSAVPNIVPIPPRYFLRNSTTLPRQPSPQNVPFSRKTETNPLAIRSQNVPSVSWQGSVQDLVSTDNLKRMKNIIFLDLDNWPSFFQRLPTTLPDLTFIWGFFGGKNIWYEPTRLATFRSMKHNGMFYLNERCGTTKDAADFAIVLTVGKMDERLPSDTAFTILSGDKGFIEVERQMKNAKRKVLVVNPHTAAQFSNDMVYALVTSITDS